MIMYPVTIFILNTLREIRDERRGRGLSDTSLNADACMRLVMFDVEKGFNERVSSILYRCTRNKQSYVNVHSYPLSKKLAGEKETFH